MCLGYSWKRKYDFKSLQPKEGVFFLETFLMLGRSS